MPLRIQATALRMLLQDDSNSCYSSHLTSPISAHRPRFSRSYPTLSVKLAKSQMAHQLHPEARRAMEVFMPKDAGGNVMVLIIEDEKVARKALAMLLARQGYEAEAVESAEEALD